MSLYKDYVEERRPNGSVIEDEDGFISYILFPEQHECFIQEIYVVPDKRSVCISREYERMVINKIGDHYTNLTATVDITAINPELNVTLMVKAGFKILSLNGNLISFIKEI